MDVPADRDALLVRFAELPAMLGYTEAAALPEFSLYGGGRVLRPGERRGAMFTAEEIMIDPGRAATLFHAVHDAGFDRDAEYSNPDIVDGTVYELTLNSGGHRYTTKAANPEENDLRFGQLLSLQRRFAEVAGAAGVYRPSKVFALGFTSGAPSTAPVWPLRSFKGAERARWSLCLMFDAAEVALVSDRSTWSVDGVSYEVMLRPALPDEHSCSDLG